MISIAAPIIESEEKEAVQKVMDSGMLAQGQKTTELEEAFAKYCGTKYAAAVNSGTAAIHAALYAAGVREGDEVITTPFSFIATINPILMLGAKPVLVDIDEDTFNIDTLKIEAAVTKKTKAIIPVHLYGQPVDWDDINKIAEKYSIVVVEDACQAVGANYGDKKAGSLGLAGCFSLYATKNIMCGEGGVVTTDSLEVYGAIRSFRQHGMTAPYEYGDLGYNYRLTDLQAAIAVEQLKKVEDFTAARIKNANFLDEALQDVSGLKTPLRKMGRTHVFHQYTIMLDEGIDRDAFIDAVRSKGVGAGVYYPKPLHAYPHIQKQGYSMGDFPIAENVASRVVSLPVHPRLSEDDLNTIASSVTEAINGK